MKNKFFLLIILSIALSVVCGMLFPQQMLSIRWIGTVFLNMLKLIALPLIFSALVSAIASMGNLRKLGSTGTYMIGYILCSVSFAVIIGLTLINVLHPGMGIDPNLLTLDKDATAHIEHLEPLTLSTFVLSLFPSNILDAAAKFQILPVVLFSIIFAIASVSAGEAGRPVIAFFKGLRDIFVKMIIWLMLFTPVGLFALLGAAIAEAVLQHRLKESIDGMLVFILVFLLGLVLQITWQLVLLKVLTRRSIFDFVKKSGTAMITAFGTSSSMATLPVSLMVAKEQNVSDEVARFVIPFASTISLAGTAMYEAVCALFFCQILGFHLSVFDQIGVFLAAVVAGMGATGIPESGLVTMVMVLRIVNVPTSAISLLLPFDRILDRFRTMVNVGGNLICAAVVDHLVARKAAQVTSTGGIIPSLAPQPLRATETEPS